MADKPKAERSVKPTAENTRRHVLIAMGQKPKVTTSEERPATKP